LADDQKTNFAPRIGFAYSVTPRIVVRSAYGIFYGGLQNQGGTNLSVNYPYQFNSNFPAPSCIAGKPCITDGITLENGFSSYITGGIGALPAVNPGANEIDEKIKTPYSQMYNLSVQGALSSSLSATVGYVGSNQRHMVASFNFNAPGVLAPPGTNTQQYQAFPGFSAVNHLSYSGSGNYNSLQASLEKRYSEGLDFLATYTYSHSFDDVDGIVVQNSTGYQNILLIPLQYNYANSDTDLRHRVTLYGNYQLPFGTGRRFLNRNGILNELGGGWAIGVVFTAQTGTPFTVNPNISTAAGSGARALLTGNPFRGGGSPNSTNPNVTCPARVRTVTHWFNPCAFSNPLPGIDIASLPGKVVTSTAQAIQYLGTERNVIHGPGYNRMDLSLFKRFDTFKEQQVEFRAETFNAYNSPAYGQPSAGINSNAGLINSTISLGKDTPDARFIQLAVKYIF
jgi:hypothetical protein